MNRIEGGGTKAEQGTHEENGLSQSVRRTYSSEKELKPGTQRPKVDKHGYPLVPQPSENEDDPLVLPAGPELFGTY